MTAAGQPDGLAVLGMFIEVGSKHEEFDKVIQTLGKIKNKSDKTPLENKCIDCNNLLPKTHEFWTYPGSLTTPPLLESVTWIVFKEPIQVSEEQVSLCFMSQFTKIHSALKLEKSAISKMQKSIIRIFKNGKKINFCTRKRFKTTKNAILNFFLKQKLIFCHI